MSRLYPPNIEGTIPAFCYDKGEEGTTIIVVPFSMNRAVSKSVLVDSDGKPKGKAGFRMNLKSVYNNTFLVAADAKEWTLDPNCYAVFEVSSK